MSDSRIPVFFVPAAQDADEAESVWNGTKTFATATTGFSITDRRVFSARYRHNGFDRHATVGEPHYTNSEPVVAIFESPECFLVCTLSRGVARDMPILIGRPIDVVDFASNA